MKGYLIQVSSKDPITWRHLLCPLTLTLLNPIFCQYLQWMVSLDSVFKVLASSSRAGWSASQRTVAPLSSRLTGSTNLDKEIQVRAFSVGLLFSWLCPDAISSLPMYHLSLAGGLAPVAMHSSSRSSPAAAVISTGLASSPTRWMTTLLGGSVKKKWIVLKS